MKQFIKDAYINVTLAVLGLLAVISFILISWPALAHLASKF